MSNKVNVIDEEKILCNGCGARKTTDQFYRANNSTGRKSECKACSRERHKLWKMKHSGLLNTKYIPKHKGGQEFSIIDENEVIKLLFTSEWKYKEILKYLKENGGQVI
jgi:hypothetical protein